MHSARHGSLCVKRISGMMVIEEEQSEKAYCNGAVEGRTSKELLRCCYEAHRDS